MNVLISGAGIDGPALAFWLARRGLRPVVVERAPALRVGGHAIDVRGVAVDVVEQMGLMAAVRAARTRIRTLSVVRGDGKRPIEIDVLRALDGSTDTEIVRDDLVRILYDATKDDAEYLFGDSIAAIDDTQVTFASGARRSFDLIVGADGQHSATRRVVFGDEAAFARPVGAHIVIFSMPNELGLEDQAMLYNEPGHGVAYYTMLGNRRAKALFIYRSAERITDLRDEAALKASLRARFEHVGWEARRLLAAMDTSPDFYIDEIAQIHMPRWSKGRLVLLGDAAHGPSPLSGQGTTLALVGARVLSDALAAQRDAPAAFAAYERRMRPFVEQNQRLVSSGMQMLIPDSRIAIQLRNGAMRLFPLLQRLGVGFGSKLERASRAIDLAPSETRH
jgi:2-polyprenyl-6-methoxyphenol hydroxylase-like FAD-dependent oxidoreductase